MPQPMSTLACRAASPTALREPSRSKKRSQRETPSTASRALIAVTLAALQALWASAT